MLARRGRLQIKPNLAKGSRTVSKPATEVSISTPADQLVTDKANLESVESVNNDTIFDISNKGTIPKLEESFSFDNSATNQPLAVIASPPQFCADQNILSPRKRIAHIPKDIIATTRARLTSTCEAPRPQNRKRKFKGDEKLDTKTMRMMDMIYWNPKAEKGLTKKLEADLLSVPSTPIKNEVFTPMKVAAPQVKIGPDGKLMLDETSLIVAETQQDSSNWETIDEDRISRKVTSLSFRNRLWRKGTAWTEKETELFYEILRCTGTDFGLMHEFFPSRARNELKSKFNREERTNWEKMNAVLSLPAMLDESLYDRAAAMAKEIELEAEEKKRKKEKSFRLCKRDMIQQTPLPEDWDETTADLIAEAKQIIINLQEEEAREKELDNGEDDDKSDDNTPSPDVGKGKKKATTRIKIPVSTRAKRILDVSKKAITKVTETPAKPKVTRRSKLKGYEEVADDVNVVPNCDDTDDIICDTPLKKQ